MKIGTPLSKNATRVMLLGSGELGKEVIISLQRFGVEVIAVDRSENKHFLIIQIEITLPNARKPVLTLGQCLPDVSVLS